MLLQGPIKDFRIEGSSLEMSALNLSILTKFSLKFSEYEILLIESEGMCGAILLSHLISASTT